MSYSYYSITNISKAAFDVFSERNRQIHGEGFTIHHDDEQIKGEIALAAACYAISGATPVKDNSAEVNSRLMIITRLWQWNFDWWKPKTSREDLVRAAALLIAEIERLDRLG